MISLTRARGLLLTTPTRLRLIQVSLGKGSGCRRVIWWPRHGTIGVRVFGFWWLSLNWWQR